MGYVTSLLQGNTLPFKFLPLREYSSNKLVGFVLTLPIKHGM